MVVYSELVIARLDVIQNIGNELEVWDIGQRLQVLPLVGWEELGPFGYVPYLQKRQVYFGDDVICFQIGAWRLISTDFCHQSMDVFCGMLIFDQGNDG